MSRTGATVGSCATLTAMPKPRARTSPPPSAPEVSAGPTPAPVGDVLLAVEAALPDTGNALTQSKDGDGTMRFAIPPATVSEVARVLAVLGQRTFYVCIVAKPETRRKSALATE